MYKTVNNALSDSMQWIFRIFNAPFLRLAPFLLRIRPNEIKAFFKKRDDTTGKLVVIQCIHNSIRFRKSIPPGTEYP